MAFEAPNGSKADTVGTMFLFRFWERSCPICGQAPSDYPEFARFLVEKGITSISLNPDTVIQTTHVILEAEAELAEAKS